MNILFIIPFAICGATWSLYLLVGAMDPMVVIGMILGVGGVMGMLQQIIADAKQLEAPAGALSGFRTSVP